MMKKIWLLFTLTAIFALVGCSRGFEIRVNPITGSVTFFEPRFLLIAARRFSPCLKYISVYRADGKVARRLESRTTPCSTTGSLNIWRGSDQFTAVGEVGDRERIKVAAQDGDGRYGFSDSVVLARDKPKSDVR